MAAGKISPIVEAIARAERGTSGEIRVHLSKRWIEKDPLGRAIQLFNQYGMFRTALRNAVILYVNLRKRKLAIYGDNGVDAILGQSGWEDIVQRLIANLRSTHHEKAIAIAVEEIGARLQRHFPVEDGAENVDELPNDVTLD